MFFFLLTLYPTACRHALMPFHLPPSGGTVAAVSFLWTVIISVLRGERRACPHVRDEMRGGHPFKQ